MHLGCRIVLWAALLLLPAQGAEAEAIFLSEIDPDLTSSSGSYRWLDVADQPYAAAYRDSYTYAQATVVVSFEASDTTFNGTLTAVNLKPNFAYQLKLVGTPDTDSNERIGLAGRWWRQSWIDSGWSSGWNLNYKGNGSSPNPNDLIYFDLRDVPNPDSPTGKQYRFTGYLLLDYFITDSDGNAALAFEANSSYHVLWKASQRTPTAGDGPVKIASFDVDAGDPAYGTSYPLQYVGVFGEWERLPIGGVFLQPGDYAGELVLTEESFHSSGGTYAGSWASAMGGYMQFEIVGPAEVHPQGDVNDDCRVNILDLILVRNHVGQDPTSTGEAECCDVNGDGTINILDLIAVRNNLGQRCE